MFIGSLYLPHEESTKGFGSCVSQYTTELIDKQVTDISTTTMGRMTTSVNSLNKNMERLSQNITNTSTTLNRKYDTTNQNIRALNNTYGAENVVKKQLDGKITTFTGEMLNIFQNIKDYVKK
jgi:hypothetical protein